MCSFDKIEVFYGTTPSSLRYKSLIILDLFYLLMTTDEIMYVHENISRFQDMVILWFISWLHSDDFKYGYVTIFIYVSEAPKIEK